MRLYHARDKCSVEIVGGSYVVAYPRGGTGRTTGGEYDIENCVT